MAFVGVMGCGGLGFDDGSEFVLLPAAMAQVD